MGAAAEAAPERGHRLATVEAGWWGSHANSSPSGTFAAFHPQVFRDLPVSLNHRKCCLV